MGSTITPFSAQIDGQDNVGQEDRQQQLSQLASNLSSQLRLLHDHNKDRCKSQQKPVTTMVIFDNCSDDGVDQWQYVEDDDEAEDEDDDEEYDKISDRPPSPTEDEKRQLLFQQLQNQVPEAECQDEYEAGENKPDETSPVESGSQQAQPTPRKLKGQALERIIGLWRRSIDRGCPEQHSRAKEM